VCGALGFEPRSSQQRFCKICSCCFFAHHKAFGNKRTTGIKYVFFNIFSSILDIPLCIYVLRFLIFLYVSVFFDSWYSFMFLCLLILDFSLCIYVLRYLIFLYVSMSFDSWYSFMYLCPSILDIPLCFYVFWFLIFLYVSMSFDSWYSFMFLCPSILDISFMFLCPSILLHDVYWLKIKTRMGFSELH